MFHTYIRLSKKMEWYDHFFVYSTILMILLPSLIFIFFHKRPSRSHKWTPGPPGWPIFGHIFSLGSFPPRTIASMGPKYGPMVRLKLGSVNTIVILTVRAAAELFKSHDLAFADRTTVQVLTSHGYHEGSLGLAPYGSRWRVLRRICTVGMFMAKRINATSSIRSKCVRDMVDWVGREEGSGIEVGRYVFLAGFNMLGNLMLSRDLVDPGSEEGFGFYGAMKGLIEISGKPNVSDLFPWTRRLDLQGLKRRMDRDMGRAFAVVSGFVKERIELRKTNGGGVDNVMEKEKEKEKMKEKDFLDVLLEFEGCNEGESGKLSEPEIIIFILEMFMAGSETTSTSIEWAMTELLRNPDAMAKVKREISGLVGPDKKLEERDIDNLPYLHAVIKETLRLHPPVPFLVPRRAIHDMTFMGYFVPKGTQVFVNAWAIGRDQECWEDALSFKPERFLGSNIDYVGQHYEFIPFGAGRRMCVGLTLGHRMLHLMLGSLVHEFDWEVEGSAATPDAIDMNERMGITAGKLHPLKAVPRKS